MWEGFVEIPGFPGYYVSNEGCVMSTRQVDEGLLMSPMKTSRVSGLSVSLVDADGRRVSRSVHDLVAQAFLPQYSAHKSFGHVVRHADGDVYNNKQNNLVWSLDTGRRDCIVPAPLESGLAGLYLVKLGPHRTKFGKSGNVRSRVKKHISNARAYSGYVVDTAYYWSTDPQLEDRVMRVLRSRFTTVSTTSEFLEHSIDEVLPTVEQLLGPPSGDLVAWGEVS